MSLKIERDTVTGTVKDAVVNHVVNKGGFVGSTAAAISEAAHGQLPGTSGKHPISAVVGTAITGGRKNAGTKGYLAVSRPAPNPLLRRTPRRRMRKIRTAPVLTLLSFPSRPTCSN